MGCAGESSRYAPCCRSTAARSRPPPTTTPAPAPAIRWQRRPNLDQVATGRRGVGFPAAPTRESEFLGRGIPAAEPEVKPRQGLRDRRRRCLPLTQTISGSAGWSLSVALFARGEHRGTRGELCASGNAGADSNAEVARRPGDSFSSRRGFTLTGVQWPGCGKQRDATGREQRAPQRQQGRRLHEARDGRCAADLAADDPQRRVGVGRRFDEYRRHPRRPDLG